MRMMMAIAALAALPGCATPRGADPAAAPVEVKIIAFNDFHGALEPPRQSVATVTPDGQPLAVPAGGAAYLATAIQSLRAANPNHVVVSAGDLISASPLVSAQFLDEPTILAMNLIGLDFNAVGNHEFDRGRAELLRMQNGGCGRHTNLQPCRVDADFPGARFRFLAANVGVGGGGTLFPGYGMRSFGSGPREVRVGFIGLTLKETPTHVTPAGVAGLAFGDEADAINALVPRLRAEGADAIVVMIHQGLSMRIGYNETSCPGMDGDLMPILARLDPAIDLVVSGHTHNAYVCDYGRIDRGRPFLVTSAGRNGTLLTDITLSIDPARGRVTARRAGNVIVQSEGYEGAAGTVATTGLYPRFAPEPAVAALVARYAAAAAPTARRVVGRLDGPALRAAEPSGESVLGDLVADAYLAATRAPENGGASIAFINSGGLRADIAPAADGSVTYGQLFAVLPFGSNLVVESLTGRQIRSLLEQQFDSGANSVERPNMLMPSAGLTYSYDLTRPAGERILDLRLHGAPLREEAVYRVAIGSFLATGGDNFTIFLEGTDPVGGPLDVDALERYLAAADRLVPPAPNRIRRLAP